MIGIARAYDIALIDVYSICVCNLTSHYVAKENKGMETPKQKTLLEDIELLPGEQVLWEGGASHLGIVVQLLHFSAFVVGILLIFTLVFGIPLFLYTENPDYRPNEKIEKIEQEGKDIIRQNTGESSQRSRTANSRIILNHDRIMLLTLIVIPLLLLYVLTIAWMRVKHSWYVVTTERVCIQSGMLKRQVVAIDIDKVVSVISTRTVLDRIFDLHGVELVHAGVNFPVPNNNLALFNPYKMYYLPKTTGVARNLINNWLPRDNRNR